MGRLSGQGRLQSKLAGTSRLVLRREVCQRASLVDSERASGVGDVPKLIVLGDVAVGRAGQAARKEVHGIGCHQRELASVEQACTLRGVNVLVGHRDGAASGRCAGLHGRFAGSPAEYCQ